MKIKHFHTLQIRLLKYCLCLALFALYEVCSEDIQPLILTKSSLPLKEHLSLL